MQAPAKSFSMLSAMLLIGIVVGASGMAVLLRRPDGPPPGGPPGGFVAHMEQAIRPRDPAQREAVRAVLEATDRQNRAAVDLAQRAMREGLDSMRTALAPLLDAAQQERLDSLLATVRRQPPVLGPPGRRPPPPRDRPR